jgi:transcriptional accessory protein Tex/SPT6
MSEQVIEQPTSINDLERKMNLQGTVTRTELYGAFVDLGLEHDGLIHISRMARRRVKKVTDKVQVGDEVNVWVLDVDPDRGRIGLTMVEPPDVDWDELKVGQVWTGRVVRMEQYGVFVDIGAERPGLLHVRDMGSYVRHPSDIVREGEQLEVRITGINRRKRQIDFAMDEGQATDVFGPDDEEPLLSPMEVAYQRARNKKAKAERRKQRGRRKQQQREEELNDIYRRTLKNT